VNERTDWHGTQDLIDALWEGWDPSPELRGVFRRRLQELNQVWLREAIENYRAECRTRQPVLASMLAHFRAVAQGKSIDVQSESRAEAPPVPCPFPGGFATAVESRRAELLAAPGDFIAEKVAIYGSACGGVTPYLMAAGKENPRPVIGGGNIKPKGNA
jgi:hypothetical protein